jgi:2'-5' RNA ligase
MFDSVSIASVVDKLAEIDRNPRQLFFYIPLDADVIKQLEGIRNGVTLPEGSDAQDFDHVTLLYIPKSETDIEQSKVDDIVRDARDVVDGHRAISARIQGWAYFDGAEKDGEKKTALVALIDAPGLEDLHVDLKSLMRRQGHPEAGTHGFTPHVTFAYLPQGARVESLPTISLSFDIDKARLANGDVHDLPLAPKLSSVKAASSMKGMTLGEAAAWLAERRSSSK